MDDPYSAWLTVADIRADSSPRAAKIQAASDEDLQQAIDLATFILFKATGERWPGTATDTCQPCARTALDNLPWWYPRGANHSSGWTWNTSWGWCSCGLGPGCTCERRRRITLGAYPVVSVTTVTIDGAVLDPSKYRLAENRWLERLDDLAWPTWQNILDPSFVVEFVKGRLPPAAGVAVCDLFALEIALANLGEECNLPSRVASIVRQGTTVNFASVSELLSNMLTGIPLVDEWVIAANGGVARPHSPATIASPDIHRAVHH